MRLFSVVGLLLVSAVAGCHQLQAALELAENQESSAIRPETEPNGTPLAATPIVPGRYLANVYPIADVDVFSFTAAAGDRVFAAVTTSFSPNNLDSTLELLAPDGTTVLEADLDDGSLGALSSSIAGAPIAVDGTYFLRVRQATNSSQIRPYDLYLALGQGPAVPEVEPNDMTPQAYPANGWVTGTLASATDVDVYSFTVAAGDTVFVSLDLDPERDGVDTAGQLLVGPFGLSGTTLAFNDAGTGSPDSEAAAVTFSVAGTYAFVVSSATGATGSYAARLLLVPAIPAGCQTYSATPALALPTGPAIVTSTITIPDTGRVDTLEVLLNYNHTNPPDLDVQLTSPQNNVIALFSDIGSATFPNVNTHLSDDAAYPAGVFALLDGMMLRPEAANRLAWMRGAPLAGTWTLTLRDDTANNGGTLNSWGLRICPLVDTDAITCGPGLFPRVFYRTDFETDDAGFTHSGTADQWARGLPSFAPLTSCASGTNCFKTNLAGTYAVSANNALLSPAIDLSQAQPPIRAIWSQQFQLEAAQFDTYTVDARPFGGAAGQPAFQWLGATMQENVGSPSVQVQYSTAWDTRTADMSGLAGQQAQLAFSFTSDTSVQLAGVAVDDVRVIGCAPPLCGDGVTQGPEQCDDGNTVSGDGCDSNCTPTGCGNGVTAGAEQCDDGNAVNGDGCDSNCTPTGCGNGVVTTGETCDDGNVVNGDGCDANCTITACGNGVITLGEACDDGNATNGDGCDSNCTPTGCGNGIPTGGEQCDDANLVSGDGCDVNCTITACGNGVVTLGETCDDANAVNGDGCDNNCTPTSCGNGITTGAELCDDGNAADGDGCDTNCTPTGCGNGIPTGGELCDDGNPVDGDGCDSNCTATSCGNGVVTMGEMCDDGNAVNGDGCDVNCTATACGNGVVSTGETCDDANAVSGDGCDVNCTVTACGNGVVTMGEICDDGNAVNGDGCDTNCTITGCGNGVTTMGEACDDGNAVNGDGCDTNCTITGCGNGVVSSGETCDDANAVSGDGCDNNCTPTACGNGVLTMGEGCDDGNSNNGDGCSAACQVEMTGGSSSSAGSGSSGAGASSGTGGSSQTGTSSSAGGGSSGAGASSTGTGSSAAPGSSSVGTQSSSAVAGSSSAVGSSSAAGSSSGVVTSSSGATVSSSATVSSGAMASSSGGGTSATAGSSSAAGSSTSAAGSGTSRASGSSAGSGSSGMVTASSSGGAGTSSSDDGGDDGSSGCSCETADSNATGVAGMMLLGLVALTRARSRRPQR